jgi:biopolymer transport protein TolQ
MTSTQKNAAIYAAKLASGRSAAIVHGEMKRGLSRLATIAATAPFVGFSGTLLGIGNSFRGIVGDSRDVWGEYVSWIRYLSESLMPTALGLLVATLAFCAFRYFSAKLNDCDVEMENVGLQLTNELGSTRVS